MDSADFGLIDSEQNKRFLLKAECFENFANCHESCGVKVVAENQEVLLDIAFTAINEIVDEDIFGLRLSWVHEDGRFAIRFKESILQIVICDCDNFHFHFLLFRAHMFIYFR